MKFLRICGIPSYTTLCKLEELFLEVIAPRLVSTKIFNISDDELCFLYDFSLQAKKALPDVILLEISNFFEDPKERTNIQEIFVDTMRNDIKEAFPEYRVGITLVGTKKGKACYYAPE